MKIVTAIAALVPLFAFTPAMATNYTVDIQNFAYVPAGRHIVTGDMITWTNLDGVIHTATSDNGVWDSGILSQGQSYSFTFNDTGTFPYHCSVHTFMVDTIFVSSQTGVSDNSSSTPAEFELAQNYPNPFNARTIISYSLPQEAHVNIDIFNVLGQEVENLADDWQGAGEHQVTWDAANQTSGVYFYRVRVDGLTKTGRMDLLK
jgi:plastocyanin